jgi:hypothetical protein
VPWPLPGDPTALLALAKAYPFGWPAGSFLYVNGAAQPLPPGYPLAGRGPVLAVGSNRAPEQLARKFGHLAAAEAEIPVTSGWMADFDIVYSAHITRYGSIAATLVPSAGTRVELALTWLTEGQLRRMHETEGQSYDFGRLIGAALALDGGRRAASPFLYHSRHGALAPFGRPLALAAVTARGRRFAAADQVEALGRARDICRPGTALDEFILEAIGDAERRRLYVAALASHSVRASLPGFELQPRFRLTRIR